jgi:hypothetical protein
MKITILFLNVSLITLAATFFAVASAAPVDHSVFMWKTDNEGLIQITVSKKQLASSDTTLKSTKVYGATTTAGILSGMEIPDNSIASPEIQVQIQEALRQQSKSNPQKSYGALGATYVGSFMPEDGPMWTSNPDVLSGVEAAALLFGGSPSDYAISTNSNTTDPSTITHTAWATTWGIGGCQEVAEDYSLDLGAPGYDDPGGANTATSAYVDDNCINGSINYVWFVKIEIAINVTMDPPTTYDSVQEAIDAASPGDEIEVYYQPTEPLLINKVLNIHYVFNRP